MKQSSVTIERVNVPPKKEVAAVKRDLGDIHEVRPDECLEK